jgi:hypothetical protein
VSIPDYISPIVGYRVWQWDAAGLKSLNGEPWLPQRRLAATCRASSFGTFVGRADPVRDAHDAPQSACTCGVYAAKSLDHLRRAGYDRYGIHGEVLLWGNVVEHEHGFRAQFAYPKSLFLPPGTLPFTLSAIQSRLQALTLYGSDIFVLGNGETISLWGKNSGFDPSGLDYLIEIGKQYYVRRQRDRTIKKGDRVAVLGRGIAVVEQVGEKKVHAVLWNRSVLTIQRKEVVWDEQNMRWEASPVRSVHTNQKERMKWTT